MRLAQLPAKRAFVIQGLKRSLNCGRTAKPRSSPSTKTGDDRSKR
jgi:hypothetical protein